MIKYNQFELKLIMRKENNFELIKAIKIAVTKN